MSLYDFCKSKATDFSQYLAKKFAAKKQGPPLIFLLLMASLAVEATQLKMMLRLVAWNTLLLYLALKGYLENTSSLPLKLELDFVFYLLISRFSLFFLKF